MRWTDHHRTRRRAGLLAVAAFVGALILTPATAALAATADEPAQGAGNQAVETQSPADDGGAGQPTAGAEDGEGTTVPEVPAIPDVVVSVDSDDGGLSRTVILLILLTVGSVAPALLLLTTTFTRFVVVLGLAKNAIGAHTVPPPQVLIGLALFLTFFVMGPTFSVMNAEAIQPMLAGEISQSEALEAGVEPLREFMLAQTREEDLALFVSLSQAPGTTNVEPATPADVATGTLIPAFIISELRHAFVIGFVIFVPFLIIDLVVASILMSLGMVMLPPMFISLPVKLLLFVLVDGWALMVGSLVGSVNPVG